MDNNGTARISEYGLETLLREESSSKSIPANVRWMAPEILGTDDRCVPSGDHGKAADIYSFAMVIFEVCLPRVPLGMFLDISHPSPQVLTGTAPFPVESDEEVVGMVAAGLRPGRPSDDLPQGSADELWELITVCWGAEPYERPTALEVLRALGEAKHREDAEDSDEETAVREWGSVTDDREPCTFSSRF